MHAKNLKNKDDLVILMHGIGHTGLNMTGLSWALQREGYKTLAITYPSTRLNIESNALWLKNNKLNPPLLHKYARIHFVCHSMGGLIAHTYIQTMNGLLPKEKMGRVVFLGTPNKGSPIADLLKNVFLYKLIFGPAGQQLTIYARIKNPVDADYELGVIAGTRGWLYPIACLFFKEKSTSHDGRVSVKSTYVDGMRDHICLPVTHSFMMWKPAIWKQVIAFLKTGSFIHE